MKEQFNGAETAPVKKNSRSTGAAVLGKYKTVTGLTMTALFAAFIAAGTFISVPLPFTPIPIVLQNMFALLAGLILGPVMGAAAVVIYLIAGLIGAPVFAGATSGIARLLGPTGGFLIGYALMALTAGLIAGSPRPDKRTSLPRIIIAIVAGLLVQYISGAAWFKITTGGTWAKVMALVFFPFLPGDFLKGTAALIITPRLRRAAGDLLSR